MNGDHLDRDLDHVLIMKNKRKVKNKINEPNQPRNSLFGQDEGKLVNWILLYHFECIVHFELFDGQKCGLTTLVKKVSNKWSESFQS